MLGLEISKIKPTFLYLSYVVCNSSIKITNIEHGEKNIYGLCRKENILEESCISLVIDTELYMQWYCSNHFDDFYKNMEKIISSDKNMIFLQEYSLMGIEIYSDKNTIIYKRKI
jgi:hypothetical protein